MITLCVNPEKIDEIWSHIKHHIEEAFASGLGDETPDSTHTKLKHGSALLWLATENKQILAAATTEIFDCPNGTKVCFIGCCGGREIEKWSGCIRDIEAFARDERCAEVRLYGRPGWKKVFGDYRETWICLKKELS